MKGKIRRGKKASSSVVNGLRCNRLSYILISKHGKIRRPINQSIEPVDDTTRNEASKTQIEAYS